MDVVEHVTGKIRTELRYGVCAMSELVVRILDVKCIKRRKNTQSLFVIKRDLHRIDSGHDLQMSYKLRHIVAEDIELQQVLIDLVIIEVSCDHVCITLVCRLLYRTELIYLMIIRYDNDTARMLSGSPLDAGAALDQIVYVILVGLDIVVFDIVLYISVSSLVSYRSYSTRLEYVLLTEYLTYISVCHRLVFAGKIKVDIRLFVSLESEECSERNVQTFLLHPRSALRTHLFRHVIACIVLIRFIRPFKVLAVRAYVMRRKRIYLCDPRHSSCK